MSINDFSYSLLQAKESCFPFTYSKISFYSQLMIFWRNKINAETNIVGVLRPLLTIYSIAFCTPLIPIDVIALI